MLNITENSIAEDVQIQNFKSYKLLKKSKIKRLSLIILGSLLLLIFICLFLPWTQNINAKGYMTTRSPEHRPQAIQSVIPGRIEKWYVQEGDYVKKGDTIVFLSEIKSEYFDPDLLERTSEQVDAKTLSVDSYQQKVSALKGQKRALEDELELKKEQIYNKILQAQNNIKIDSIDLVAYINNNAIAENQLERIKELNSKGLSSLSELQEKELKLQNTSAKVNVQRNKLVNQRNELLNLQLELLAVERSFAEKIAKNQSEQQSAIASRLNSVADAAKLQNQLSNYSVRSKMNFITAPQSGYITQTMKKGLGETVKEGTDVATIMPDDYELAVEIYVQPLDLPLLSIGNHTRLRFDGWPAIVISGWPDASTGIFSGKVAAIDRFTSDNGLYRVLISPDEEEKAWPKELRVGAGAMAFVLLKDVPIWYEIWRQLNGFPAEFYELTNEKDNNVKLKAPIKSIK